MTMIIGFKNNRGDILIAADCRVTFTVPPDRKNILKIRDELQKIYFFRDDIAIAFSGNNISEIKNIFNILQKQIDSSSSFDSNSFIGLLKANSKSIKAKTTFILGILKNNQKRLYHFSISNSAVEVDEIINSNYKYSGSALCEGGNSLKTEVMDRTFSNCKLPIRTIVALLTSLYSTWLQRHTMQTVGELLCTIEGSNNCFGVIPYTNKTIFRNGFSGKLTVDYDQKKRNIYQCDEISGKKYYLLPLDRFSFRFICNRVFKWLKRRNSP